MIGTSLAIALAAISAGGQVAGSAIASHASGKAGDKQVAAANRAAEAQAQSNREALQFQREESARNAAIAETNRHANYDQWAAQRRGLGTLADLIGAERPEIPAYVPLPSSGAPGAPAPAGSGARGGSAAGGSADALRSLVEQYGPANGAQRFNQQFGRVRGNEAVFYPESNAVSIPEGKLYGGAGGWQWSGTSTGAAAPAAAGKPAYAPTGPTLASFMPLPVAPARNPYTPPRGSLGSFAYA